MLNRFQDDNPFWRWMGFQIDEQSASEGRAIVTVEVRPEFLQHQKLVHGGVLSALIDSAGAWAFGLEYGEAVRTINLSVQYLSPAVPTTPELAAEARVVRAGRRIVITEVNVHGLNGLNVARGQVIYSRARS